jgi:hypothetical protein
MMIDEYNPRDMPEVTVQFTFSPAERQTYFEPGCPAEVEMYGILIHNQEVSEDLQEDLFERYGEKWEEEIFEINREEKLKQRI